jgi:1-acyl-sn-glycerol-3-phosphate acyltransferase
MRPRFAPGTPRLAVPREGSRGAGPRTVPCGSRPASWSPRILLAPILVAPIAVAIMSRHRAEHGVAGLEPGGALLAGDAPRSVLARRVERALRVAGTGCMFATFGIGAVLLAAVVLPLFVLLRGRSRAPDLLAQRAIHHTFRGFVRLGSLLGLMHLDEHGTERLRQPGMLVVANHPTLLDVVYLISRMPQADCVVKAQAFANPALRGIVKAAGYLPNRDGEHMIAACAERLAAGRSLVIFPEGSRSPVHGLGHFHRGFAHMALRSGAKVLPVLITCDPPALKRGQPWYKLPNARLDFRLEVGEPLDGARVAGDGTPRGVAARRLADALRMHFEARSSRGTT